MLNREYTLEETLQDRMEEGRMEGRDESSIQLNNGSDMTCFIDLHNYCHQFLMNL